MTIQGAPPDSYEYKALIMKKYIQTAREEVATYSMIGNEALIDLQHLIAVIIGHSSKPELCGKIAKDGLRGLLDLSVYDLEHLGLTHNQALRLHSAILLAKKLKNVKPKERYVIRTPEDGARYVMEEMRFLNQEHFVVLFLNTKNEVIHKQTIFVGTLNSSVVHPREVFREAVKRSSAAIIAVHNHPSGDPTPSREDIAVTRRLYEAGELMGISFLDHLVIGDKKYVSMKEKGYL